MFSLNSLGIASFATILDGAPACWFPQSAHDSEVALIARGSSVLRSYAWVVDEAVRGDVPVVAVAGGPVAARRTRHGVIASSEFQSPGVVTYAWWNVLNHEAAARLDALPDGGTEDDLDREVARLMREVQANVDTFVEGVYIDHSHEARGAVDEGVRGEDLVFIWNDDMWSFDQRLHGLVCRRAHAGAGRCKRLDTPDFAGIH